MREMRLESVIHVDSDLMLYFDPKRNPLNIEDAELAIGSTGSYSGHFAIIPSLASIQRVCGSMVRMFKDSALLAELEAHYDRQKAAGGGVCDMYVLGYIARHGILRVYELNVVRENKIFDQSMGDNRISGKIAFWSMEGRFKRIVWRDGVPFMFDLSGNAVQALTLHFQGGAKRHMIAHMTGRPLRFFARWIWVRLGERFGVVSSKLRFCGRHYWRAIRKRLRPGSLKISASDG